MNLAQLASTRQNRLMLTSALHRRSIAPSATSASALAALFVDERDTDAHGVLIPRTEIQLVARFGAGTNGGLDVHALGARSRVHRKFIRRGLRTVTARLQLGTHEAVLGVPASAIAERIVPLEELWGDTAAQSLFTRLAEASDTKQAAHILQRAITERFALAPATERRVGTRLALDAASRLSRSSVSAVAAELGVSERHLRRVFQEAVGVNPKEFAQLSRFRRALHAARSAEPANWASIACAAGYYDQAHLIAEFRAIAGVTPRALLAELHSAMSIG